MSPGCFDDVARQVVVDKRQLALYSTLLELYHDRIFPSAITLARRLDNEKFKSLLADTIGAQCQETRSPISYLDSAVDAALLKPDVFVVSFSSVLVDPVGSQAAGRTVESLTLTEDPPGFKGWIDPTSQGNTYSAEIWTAFDLYLKSSAGLSFKGGRYGMAASLKQLDLPFLRNKVLGEICHIVQLALHHRLIAYIDGMLVPAAAHAACINAVARRPTVPLRLPPRSSSSSSSEDCQKVSGQRVADVFVVSQEELRRVVTEVLAAHPEGLDLSKLKRKIWESQQLRLSETVFGCTRLLELVSSDILRDICNLHWQGCGAVRWCRVQLATQFDPAASSDAGAMLRKTQDQNLETHQKNQQMELDLQRPSVQWQATTDARQTAQPEPLRFQSVERHNSQPQVDVRHHERQAVDHMMPEKQHENQQLNKTQQHRHRKQRQRKCKVFPGISIESRIVQALSRNLEDAKASSMRSQCVGKFEDCASSRPESSVLPIETQLSPLELAVSRACIAPPPGLEEEMWPATLQTRMNWWTAVGCHVDGLKQAYGRSSMDWWATVPCDRTSSVYCI